MTSSESSLSHGPESGNPQLYLPFAFVDCSLAIAAVISNAVLLITVYQDPHRNLRTPVTSLVVNLSVCDMLAGSITGFGSTAVDIAFYTGSRSSMLGVILLVVVVSVFANVVGSCTIVAMSFDRWFAIASPLRYRASLTSTKIKLLIAVIWTYAFLFAALSPMGVSLTTFTLLYCHLHVSLPLVVLAFIYWHTYRALRSHSNQVQDLASHANNNMNSAHSKRERKVTFALVLVLIVFYSVFSLHFIALNVLVLCPPCGAVASFQAFHSVSFKLPLASYSINPFIYAWRIPKYKRAFQTVLKRCFRRNPRNRIHAAVS